MSAPVYRDPVFDGATDPTVIHRWGTDEWWMFYTQRRTSDPGPGVRWLHGTEVGIAVSHDFGATWDYAGVADGLERGNTLWAPEVIRVHDHYIMYVTVVDGVRNSWAGADAHIVEYHSENLRHWDRRGRIDLGSDRVIDASVAQCADGVWRMWFKNERDGSSTWSASSPDLGSWTVEGRAIPPTPPHEGPNVFRLGDWYWMVTDEWRGLGVHRSENGVQWDRQRADQGLILQSPGADPEDRNAGQHAAAVVVRDRAVELGYLYYFTHPASETAIGGELERRRSAVHVAALEVRDDILIADRNVPARTPVLRSTPRTSGGRIADERDH